MPKILVTGGAGYIGSHAVRALIQGGHQVTVIDNLSKGHREAVHPDALFLELDLSDREALERVFSEAAYDAVMHFAGSIEVSLSMSDPALFFQNNCTNGLHLLEAMRRHGVKNIIFSSTAAVYGNPQELPVKESAPLMPTNFYGESKLIFERILEQYRQMFGFQFVALRYFNAAGADASGEIGQDYDPPTHLIGRVLKYALGQLSDLKIYGSDYPTKDGTCVRDYIHVSDLVDAHLLALNYLQGTGNFYHDAGSGDLPAFPSNRSNIFNLGNGQGFSVREVLQAAEQVTGLSFSVKDAPRREGDPTALIADSSRARKILGWKPKFTRLEDMVASAWKWFQLHPNGYGVGKNKDLG